MKFSVALLAAVLVTGCSGPDPRNRQDLRAAVDKAQVTLREAVPIALTSTDNGDARAGVLIPGLSAFDVGARDAAGMKEIRVAHDGLVAHAGPTVEPNVPACPGGAIALDPALAIAEARASGEAIAVVPDDEVACAREIQVLSDITLYEVKVGGAGAVLEFELSDEFSGSED